jgi:hypothetical protein
LHLITREAMVVALFVALRGLKRPYSDRIGI